MGLSGLMACSFLGSYGQQINPMTEAVLQGYNDILAENPKDYLTLYDRASQYCEMGEYARALSDIEMALEYTPADDKAYRAAEYSLKGDILTAQKNYAGAVEAVNSALALNSSSLPDLYKLGNLYLLTNQPEDALRAFERLQRANPRSQEAYYGMAKANAMMGRTQDADNLIKEVENFGKQSFVTYCRIGDLYSDIGNVKDATTNYAIAYTMEDHNNRPVESLKFLARKNPSAVMEAIDGLILNNSDNVALNYLKAIVAFDAGLYAQAEKACKDLASAVNEDSPAVYRMMAMSQLAQNKVSEAKQSIATAESLSSSGSGVYIDKAEILMIDNPAEAYNAAKQALMLEPDNETALMVGANAAILAGDYPAALSYLNNVVLSNPSNAEALLLRGYLNTEYLNDGKAGIADYTRAGNVHQDGSTSTVVYAALGKQKAGKKLDADGMINEAIQKAAGDKNDLYLIAVYFAQSGNLEKAKEFADKAVAAGYSNVYDFKTNNQPLFNLSPIRHLFK